MVGPSKKMKNRIIIVGGALLFLLVVLVPLKLFNLQIANFDKYEEYAISQQTRDKIIEPARGTIYDRNMKVLAISANVEQVTADPTILLENEEDVELIASELSKILQVDEEELLEKLLKDTSYVVLKAEVEKEQADEVRAFLYPTSEEIALGRETISGISLVPDTKRYYPQGSLASTLLGFTGTDGTGLEGIEAHYNETLSGTAGRIISTKDAEGNEMPFEYEQLIEPLHGESIVLTIDQVIQYFLEKHLETARADTNPLNGVSGIVMDVKTGEILAMATKGDYDPNRPFAITDEFYNEVLWDIIDDGSLSDEEEEILVTEKTSELQQTMWRNKPVLDSYEPGSTFKIFTVAMALEEGVVSLEDTFYCPGYKQVADYRISCHKHEGHGTQTLLEALQNSCNPAMIEISERVGEDTFYSYIDLFGFTEKTGIDLSGETTGIRHELEYFNEVELATYSFGQTFQVTPLQMITGVSAIANDGYMVKPHVVKEILDTEGKIVDATETEYITQVVSKETSDIMKEGLELVVTNGGGRNAYVKGYRVGGKTATSEKVTKQLETGGKHYIASFIGVAPMDDPQIAVLVMIDEPQGYLYMGGQIAAPVVGRIMADILPYIGVTPEYTEEELASIDVTIPSVIDLNKEDATNLLKNQNLSYRTIGSGDVVTDQVPAPQAKAPASATVILYMGEEKPTSSIEVPDISGKTATEAKKILEDAGLFLRTTGASALASGSVQTTATYQSPEAGTEVLIGTVINVEFTDIANVSD